MTSVHSSFLTEQKEEMSGNFETKTLKLLPNSLRKHISLQSLVRRSN